MSQPLIYPVGTRVVVQKDTYHASHPVAHPAGSVGVVVRSPIDRAHSYRVKFNDGFEAPVHHDQFVPLSKELERSYEESKLPEMPTGRDALSDLLVRLRLREARLASLDELAAQAQELNMGY